MKKWEYNLVEFNTLDELNKLGSERWEVVLRLPDLGALLLKREL